MFSDTLTISGTIGGLSIQSGIAKSASSRLGHDFELPAAKAGSLTLRTDNDTGSVTLGSGHGILTGDIVDLYWTGGRRYNVVAGTVAGDVVPIDLGSGNNLPAQDTAVTLVKQAEVDTDFDGDLLVALGLLCAGRGRVGFKEAATTALNVDLVAGELYFWLAGGSGLNPLATFNPTSFSASQASSSAAARLQVGALYTGTP